MDIGTWVYYRKFPNAAPDYTLGIVSDIDEDGMIRVDWVDGLSIYYSPIALIKV